MTKEKVIIAMSGGVDSSAAACLLKDQGYDVIGVHLRLWFDEDADTADIPDDGRRCCAISNAEDARMVADKLGIPFYVLNCRNEFHSEVVEYFCAEYLAGRTPNPCTVCNEKIKFGYLLKKADELGAKYVATGHYAVIEQDTETNRYLLKKGHDEKKDQSYFLFSLSQDQLSRILFPLGKYSKPQVRELAKNFGLNIHKKKESQEICFITNDNYRDFLQRRYPEKFKSGNIVNASGKVLGQHEGVFSYTIGQRKGIGVSNPTPLYVIATDVEKNEVIVGEKDELFKESCIVENITWISIEKLETPLECLTMIRYNHPGAPSTIEPIVGGKAEPIGNGRVKVTFDQPEKAIAPGQAAVFYDGEAVIGGGWIKKE